MLWAQALLADSALEAIARYTETSAGDSSPTLIQRKTWLQSYRTVFAARHRGIPLPDINGRNLIDYQKLYVYPQIRTSRGEILDLSSLIQDFQRSVLLGDPGAGKSTFSNVAAMSYVEHSEIVPFHITMREVEITATGFSVVQQIEAQLTKKYQLPPPQNLVEQLLIEGAAALLFDGLDELLDPTTRKQAAEVIELAAARYPSTSVLVTCRLVGYPQARLAPALFDEVSIMPFDDARVADYVRKWFVVSELYDSDTVVTSPSGWSVDDKVAEFMDLSSSIADIRDNPLLLSFICAMYRTRRYIPRNRPQLFDQCVDLLLRAWDATRGVTRDVADESYEFALAEVAEFITSRPEFRTGVPEDVLKDVFTEHLKKDAGYPPVKARATASTMVSHCEGRAWIFSDAGLTPDGERLYAFTHSSFQEYFYAWWLTRALPQPEDLAHELSKLLSDGRSQIAVQVAIHLCDLHTKGGGSECIAALIESGGPPAVLLEAADAVRLQPDVISKIAKSIISHAARGGTGPADLLKIVNKDFRHSDGLASLYQGALRSALSQASDEGLIRLAWLVTNASSYLVSDGAWAGVGAGIEDGSRNDERFTSVARIYASRSDLAFQVALRRGLVSIAAIAQLSSREFLTKLFEQCQDSIARIGDSSTAVWLIRVLGTPGSSRAARLWATQALRAAGLKVSADNLAALPLSTRDFDSVRRSVIILLREGRVAGALSRMAVNIHVPFWLAGMRWF